MCMYIKYTHIYKKCCDKIREFDFYFYFRSRKDLVDKMQGVSTVVPN